MRTETIAIRFVVHNGRTLAKLKFQIESDVITDWSLDEIARSHNRITTSMSTGGHILIGKCLQETKVLYGLDYGGQRQCQPLKVPLDA